MDLTKLELAVLARQLGNPEGEIGRAGFRSVDVEIYRETTQRLDGGTHDRSYHILRAAA